MLDPALRHRLFQLRTNLRVGYSGDLRQFPHLRQANSLLGSARNATKVLGPSVAGVLVVTIGSGPAIAFDAVSFLIAAVCLARLPLTTRASALRRPGILTDIHEGWTQFRRGPDPCPGCGSTHGLCTGTACHPELVLGPLSA